GFDTDTIVWETETGKRLSNLSGRTNMAYQVAFSPDGSELVSGGRTRWDLRTGRGLRITPETSEKTYGILSPDGRNVAVMKMNSGVISIVESPSGKLLHTLTPSSNVVFQRARFNADGSVLAVTYGPPVDQHPTAATAFSSQITLWDVKNGRELRSLTTTEIPMELGFTADGRLLATVGSSGQISLWD